MSMLDCEKCWEVFCECGYQYKDYSTEKCEQLIKAILKFRTEKEKRLILEGVNKENVKEISTKYR